MRDVGRIMTELDDLVREIKEALDSEDTKDKISDLRVDVSDLEDKVSDLEDERGYLEDEVVDLKKEIER